MIDISKPIIFRYKIEWMGGFIFFLGGSMFTAIGVCMIASGVRSGWFVAGFCGLIPCLCFLRLLPNCAFVRISRKGVELRDSFRSVLFPWDEIESFEFINFPPHDIVEMVVTVPGTDDADRIGIRPVYDIMPAILVNLLNDWKYEITNTTSTD